MEVRPAEAEGTDSGPPRVLSPRMEPGLGLGAEPKGTIAQLEPRVGRLDPDRGWQDLMIERQRRVDQPGQPGGALRVADQRLDRAHDAATPSPPGGPEHPAEGIDLHHVAH